MRHFLLLDINLQNPFVKVLLPLIGIVAIVLLCKYKYHYSLVDNLQLRKPRFQQLLLWLIIASVWMAGTDYLIGWRGLWDFTPWISQPLYVSILRVLAVCFLGPIVEELIFRGLLFYRLVQLKKMNEWITAILLAAVWACIHYTYSLAVIAIIFIEGILLGAALIKSRSLVVPIMMHICWNFVCHLVKPYN